MNGLKKLNARFRWHFGRDPLCFPKINQFGYQAMLDLYHLCKNEAFPGGNLKYLKISIFQGWF